MIEKVKDIQQNEVVVNKKHKRRKKYKDRAFVRKEYLHISNQKRIYAVCYRKEKIICYNLDADYTSNCKIYYLKN